MSDIDFSKYETAGSNWRTEDPWEQWVILASDEDGGYDWSAMHAVANKLTGELGLLLNSGCSCYGTWDDRPDDLELFDNSIDGWAKVQALVLEHADGGYYHSPSDVTKFLQELATELRHFPRTDVPNLEVPQ